jgi:DNA-binding response OmpR family regulator
MSKRTITRDNLSEARILVVEDEPMLAFAFEESLVEAGFEIAGVASRVGQALKIIERGECDAAIIDANLAGVSAGPIALALAALSIPYIVVSGYSQEQQQGAFHGALFIQKPCRLGDLIRAVGGLFVAPLLRLPGAR